MRRLGDKASRRRGLRDWEGRWRVFEDRRRRGSASAVSLQEEREGARWKERWSGGEANCQTYCWLWRCARAAMAVYDASVDKLLLLLRGGRRALLLFFFFTQASRRRTHDRRRSRRRRQNSTSFCGLRGAQSGQRWCSSPAGRAWCAAVRQQAVVRRVRRVLAGG